MVRLVKTGLTGAGATAIEVAGIVLLVEVFSVPVGLAAFFAALFGATVNLILSKYWAFGERTPIGVGQVSRYALVALCTSTLNGLTVHVLATIVGLHYLIAKAISATSIFLLWSYPAQAKLVFVDAPAARSFPQRVGNRGAL